MNVFPAFWRTTERTAAIVGAGETALRKIRLLVKTTATVRVYLGTNRIIGSELQAFADAGRIEILPRAITPEDAVSCDFAIIASEDERELQTAYVILKAAQIPVNVVDRTELCDFTVPAIVERGDIAIGIASGGVAPVLARKIRERVEAALPKRIGNLAAFARDFRSAVAAERPPGHARKSFWERVIDGPIGKAVLAGDDARAREWMIGAINRTDTSAVSGRVALVGAGPGDPELLTLKALHALQSADIVYYDNLVGDDILDLIRRDAERIYVGKRTSNHAVPQGTIQDRMIASARKGLYIVRLKGGDPFVFGRGGEEVDAVRAAGIPVDIVPGITAATGAAASAGIPLTHRDHAQSVTFVTGHDRNGLPDLDWRALASGDQTVVVYMGVGTSGRIAQNLIDAGAPASRPVAIVENATLPHQKTVVGRLGQMEELVAMYDIKGPALIVIGDVASHADEGRIGIILHDTVRPEVLEAANG